MMIGKAHFCIICVLGSVTEGTNISILKFHATEDTSLFLLGYSHFLLVLFL